MITADDVERALEWLRNNAEEASEARANRVQLEEFTKHIKASLMEKYAKIDPDAPVSAQERYALAHADYKLHLTGLREAVKNDEKFRWLKDVALTKCEVWRSLESTKRALGA